MIQSMTGYGRIDTELFTIESRSVNHRYLDIYIKTPPYLHHIEPHIRSIIKEEFTRGKVSVTVTQSSNAANSLQVNEPLVAQLHDAFTYLKKELGLNDEIKIDHFLQFKAILTMEEPEVEDTYLFEALRKSLSELKKMREQEGSHLLRDLHERISLLNSRISTIESRSHDHTLSIKERYMGRIKELIQESAIDEVRLLQEAAIIAEKADITEEIVRIRTHIEHFISILNEPDPSGKKMDFLCQELHREINTIGSKANNADITTLVIHMKSELEKLREQVQNIQ